MKIKICKDGRIWGRMNTDYHDPEYIKKQRESKLGNKYHSEIKHSEETKRKIRENCPDNKGSKHWNWQGGITPLDAKIRNSEELKQWRKDVFERDHYTCLVCGQVGGEINAHHIKSFKKYPELRFDVDNGVTLCIDCHKLKHKFRKKGGN